MDIRAYLILDSAQVLKKQRHIDSSCPIIHTILHTYSIHSLIVYLRAMPFDTHCEKNWTTYLNFPNLIELEWFFSIYILVQQQCTRTELPKTSLYLWKEREEKNPLLHICHPKLYIYQSSNQLAAKVNHIYKKAWNQYCLEPYNWPTLLFTLTYR